MQHGVHANSRYLARSGARRQETSSVAVADYCRSLTGTGEASNNLFVGTVGDDRSWLETADQLAKLGDIAGDGPGFTGAIQRQGVLLPECLRSAEALQTAAILPDDARIDPDAAQCTGMTHGHEGGTRRAMIGDEEED